MKLALALTIALAGSAPQTPPTAAVRGVVHGVDGEQRRPLQHAMVELLLPGGSRTAMSDSLGQYVFMGVPGGSTRIRAQHVAYAAVELEVLVPASSTLVLDLVLRGQPLPLPPIRVGVDAVTMPDPELPGGEGRESTDALVELRALEATSGLAEAGLGDAMRALPGNDPHDPSDVLLMRGSTTDMKLVLLDGAPVYAPFHTGGLLQSFDVEALGGAAHHVGGAPARYDGGLSYILDLRTRPARTGEWRSWGSADLLSVRGGLEAPLGSRLGVLAVGRALHGGASQIAGGDASPYGYIDGLVRTDLVFGEASRLFVTGFANREAVRLNLPPSPSSPGIEEARWGNGVIALNYRRTSRPVTVDLGLATSVYEAEIPIRHHESDPEPLPTSPPDIASGSTARTRLTADFGLPALAGGLRFGANLDRVNVRYGVAEGVSLVGYESGEGWVAGAYVDGVQRLAPEFDLRYGMRVDHFQPGGGRVAPRLALLWSFAPDAMLTLAAGRYHQLARLADSDADLGAGESIQVGAGPLDESGTGDLLRVATADHVTLSLDHLVSDRIELAIEGFYKRFHGLDRIDGSTLASSGIDLRVVRRADALTGWVGYSLAWFWETDGGFGTVGEFSGRHLLSTGLSGRIAGPVGMDARVSFSDGLPLTAIPFSDAVASDAGRTVLEQGTASRTSVPSSLEDGFLRIDVELHAEWSRNWRGRDFHVRPYVKLLNALNRRDALFYYFEPWRDDGVRPLADLPVVPVLGVSWRF